MLPASKMQLTMGDLFLKAFKYFASKRQVMMKSHGSILQTMNKEEQETQNEDDDLHLTDIQTLKSIVLKE